MESKSYFNVVFRRTNLIKAFIFGLFFFIASWPRLILEVFFRRQMGHRYMSLATAVTLFLAMIFWHMRPQFSGFGGWESPGFMQTVHEHPSTFIFAIIFLAVSIKRYRESEILKAKAEGDYFTLSTGLVYDFFYGITIGGKIPSRRTIATIYEPALSFIIGVVLVTFHIPVGLLICVCSVIYSLSYFAGYYLGDEMVWDFLDDLTCKSQMISSLVDGKEPDKTKGFEFQGFKPKDPNLRRKMADHFRGSEPGTRIL